MGESYPTLSPAVTKVTFQESWGSCLNGLLGSVRTTPFPGGHTLCVEHIFPQGETVSQMLTENAGSMTDASPSPKSRRIWRHFSDGVSFSDRRSVSPSLPPALRTPRHGSPRTRLCRPPERHRPGRDHRCAELCSQSTTRHSPRPHRLGLKEHKNQICTARALLAAGSKPLARKQRGAIPSCAVCSDAWALTYKRGWTLKSQHGSAYVVHRRLEQRPTPSDVWLLNMNWEQTPPTSK